MRESGYEKDKTNIIFSSCGCCALHVDGVDDGGQHVL